MEDSPVIEENELRAAISEVQSENGELVINTDMDDSSSTDSACTTGTRTSPPRNLPRGQPNPNDPNRSQNPNSARNEVDAGTNIMEIEAASPMHSRGSYGTAHHTFVSPPSEPPRHAPTPMLNSRPSTADQAAALAMHHQRQMHYIDPRSTGEVHGHQQQAHFGPHSPHPTAADHLAAQQHLQLQHQHHRQQHQQQQQHLPSYREAFAHRLQTHPQYDPRTAAAAAATMYGYGTYGASAQHQHHQQYFQQQQQHQAAFGHPGYHAHRQRFPISAADVQHLQQQQQAQYGLGLQQQYQHQHQHHETRQPTATASQAGTSEGSSAAEQPEAAGGADTSNQQQANVVEAIHNALIGLGADPGNVGSVNTLPRGEHVIVLPHAGNPLDHLFTHVLIAKTTYQLMKIPNNSVPSTSTSNSRPPTAGPQRPPSGGGGQGHPPDPNIMHQQQRQHQPHQPHQWSPGTRCPQHGHPGVPSTHQMNQQRQMYYQSNWMPPTSLPITFPSMTTAAPLVHNFEVKYEPAPTPTQVLEIKLEPMQPPVSRSGRRGSRTASTPSTPKVVKSRGKDLRRLGISNSKSNRGGRSKTETPKRTPKPRAPRKSKKMTPVPQKVKEEASISILKAEQADETEPPEKKPKVPSLTIRKIAKNEPTSTESQPSGGGLGSTTSTINVSKDPTENSQIESEENYDSDCVEIVVDATEPRATPSTSRELRKRKPVLYFDPNDDHKPRSRAAKRPKKESKTSITAQNKHHLENTNHSNQSWLVQKPLEEKPETRIRLLPPKKYFKSKKVIYVNQKQYKRIMERRRIREMLEASGRLPLHRSKTYIHESRHRHAVTRPRYPDGKFMRKCDILAAQRNKTTDQVQRPTPDDVFKKPLPPKDPAAQKLVWKATVLKPQAPTSRTSNIPPSPKTPQTVHQQMMAERQRNLLKLQFKRLDAEHKQTLMRAMQSSAMKAKGRRPQANMAKPLTPQLQVLYNLMKRLRDQRNGKAQAAKSNIPATVSKAPDAEPSPKADTLKEDVPNIVVTIESARPQTTELKIPEVTFTAIK